MSEVYRVKASFRWIVPFLVGLVAFSLIHYGQIREWVSPVYGPDRKNDRKENFEYVQLTLRQLSETPRPRGSEGHAKAQQLILDKLRENGFVPETLSGVAAISFIGWVRAGHVSNILLKIPGTNKSNLIHLMVAHYDSVPNSKGAADNAMAVATLLGVAKTLAQKPPPQTTWLLFSDAEEDGLMGTKLFLNTNPNIVLDQQKVFVTNFDARGSGGPVFVADTAGLDAHSFRELSRRVAGVRFNEVLGHLAEFAPNATDFMNFKNAGMRGFTFAFSRRSENYHSQNDDFEHVDFNTLREQLALAMQMSQTELSFLDEHRDVGVALTAFGGPLVISGNFLTGLLIFNLLLTLLFVYKKCPVTKNNLAVATGLTAIATIGLPFSALILGNACQFISVASFLVFLVFLLVSQRCNHTSAWIASESIVVLFFFFLPQAFIPILLPVIFYKLWKLVPEQFQSIIHILLFASFGLITSLIHLLFHVDEGQNIFLVMPLLSVLGVWLLCLQPSLKILRMIAVLFLLWILVDLPLLSRPTRVASVQFGYNSDNNSTQWIGPYPLPVDYPWKDQFGQVQKQELPEYFPDGRPYTVARGPSIHPPEMLVSIENRKKELYHEEFSIHLKGEKPISCVFLWLDGDYSDLKASLLSDEGGPIQRLSSGKRNLSISLNPELLVPEFKNQLAKLMVYGGQPPKIERWKLHYCGSKKSLDTTILIRLFGVKGRILVRAVGEIVGLPVPIHIPEGHTVGNWHGFSFVAKSAPLE